MVAFAICRLKLSSLPQSIITKNPLIGYWARKQQVYQIKLVYHFDMLTNPQVEWGIFLKCRLFLVTTVASSLSKVFPMLFLKLAVHFIRYTLMSIFPFRGWAKLRHSHKHPFLVKRNFNIVKYWEYRIYQCLMKTKAL